MKKQIVLIAGLALVFLSALKTKAQQPGQPPITQRQNLNNQGPSETPVTCGGNQYTLICSRSNHYLTVLGSENDDNVDLWYTGPAPYLCASGSLEIFLDRVCPNVTAISVYTYGGNDRINASLLPIEYASANIFEGGAGNDKIKGTVGDDQIRGGAGNDQIWGDHGDDIIEGGDGNDKIDGGAGDDAISGGNGNDEIFAELYLDPRETNNNDSVNGNAGNDCLSGLAGLDYLNGGAGDDHISGGGALGGGGGNDHLKLTYCLSDLNYISQVAGDQGNDVLTSSACAERLEGGQGNDLIFLSTHTQESPNETTGSGGAGDDTLYSDTRSSAPAWDSVEHRYDLNNCGDFCGGFFDWPRNCVPPTW